jgi:TonB-linked SusC/RagA family outer membrane protein
MKLTLCLLLFFTTLTFAETGNAQNARVSLNTQQATLKDVLKEIEQQTDYLFISNREINLDRKVSIRVESKPVNEVLDQLFTNFDLSYSMEGVNIIITQRTTAIELKQQTGRRITGIVTDPQGEAVVGVNVVEKGTTNGIITDVDGKFSLSVSENATLIFTYIGFNTQEVAVGNQASLKITLSESSFGLDEVVAIGYGTQKRSDLIGSVGSVSQKALTGKANLTVEQALQGNVAGVMVTSRSAQPGSAPSVRIRGIGTLNDNAPLYIVDGVPMNTGMEIVNNQDIESIEILKDAASASIYGSRAGNGVVLISTKKGTSTKPTVFYDGNVGFNEASKRMDVLNAAEYTMIMDEAFVNNGNDPYWKTTTPRADTDWQSYTLRRGLVQSHLVGVKGKADNIRYYLSAGYDDQDGSIIETSYKRYSIKSNLNVDVTTNLSVGMNLLYAYGSDSQVNQGNSVLKHALWMPPTVPAYDGDKTGYPLMNESDEENPIFYAKRTKSYNHTYSSLINLFGDYQFIPALRFHSSFSGNLSNWDYSQFNPTADLGPYHNQLATLSESYSKGLSLTFENTLTYNEKFNELHELTAMIGQSFITYDTKSTSASKKGFPSNEDYLRYFSAGTEQDQVSGNRNDWALVSYFGRINYSFANKYLFQFNMRTDGSSRFGKNNKWGKFPSAALGWRLSEEQFLKGVDWLSNLKFRGSYGVLGTMPTSYYGFTSTLTQFKLTLGTDQSAVIGYYPPNVENNDFKWETTYQTNLGVDIGLWNNKLSFTIEYYNKLTKDILQVLPLPRYAGTSGSLTNIGEMRNRGMEFSASINDNIGNLHYSVSGNMATLKNKILKLFDNDAPISSGVCRTEVGRSIGEFYGYVYDGLFQNQAEIETHKVQPLAVPGDVRFKNMNNDDRLDANDMTFIGSPIPFLTYGANIGLEYKNIDFALSFTGVAGNKIYFSSQDRLISGGNNYNKLTKILKRWQKEGDKTNVPRVSLSNPNNNFRTSDLLIESGNYLRISNVQLGYTLKSTWMKGIGFQYARIYLSVNNLATFTKYSGYDPEINIENALNAGSDAVTYPVPRTMLFGLNLTF